MPYESLPVSNDEYYRAYRIASDLFDYDTSSTGSADVYVYLPKLDMVISPRGYFHHRQLQVAQRPLLDAGYESWLASFADVTRSRFRPSQSMSLSEEVPFFGQRGNPVPGHDMAVTTRARAVEARQVRRLRLRRGGPHPVQLRIEGDSYQWSTSYPGFEGERWPVYTDPMNNDPDGRTLAQILREILIANSADTMMAGSDAGSMGDHENIADTIEFATTVEATVPILLLNPFLQKYFVKGALIGSVKG